MTRDEFIGILRGFNQRQPTQNQRCGLMSTDFIDLIASHGITGRYIGLYCEPLAQTPVSRMIADDWKNHTGYVDSLVQVPRYSAVRWTHVLVEVGEDNERVICDPSNGVLYRRGKEDLVRGIGVQECIDENIDFLLSSVHLDTNYMYYMTPRFWRSVYYLAYDNGEGIDMVQRRQYNRRAWIW